MQNSKIVIPLASILTLSNILRIDEVKAIQFTTHSNTEFSQVQTIQIGNQRNPNIVQSTQNCFYQLHSIDADSLNIDRNLCKSEKKCSSQSNDFSMDTLISDTSAELYPMIDSLSVIGLSSISFKFEPKTSGIALSRNKNNEPITKKNLTENNYLSQAVNSFDTNTFDNSNYDPTSICQCSLETTVCAISGGGVPPIGGVGGPGFPFPALSALAIPPLLIPLLDGDDGVVLSSPPPSTPIPEPGTILGTLAAISFGISVKRKKGKS